MSKEKINLSPIGYVQTDAVGEEVKDKSRTSQIILKKELVKGLEGISDYSHLFIIFWLDQVKEEDRLKLKVHPRGRTDMPLTGVFAVRTMLRPNPIGLTLVQLLNIEDNKITVRGLDAYNRTPILDIKPYDPMDTTENPKVPEWWLRLKEE